jgi:hypothetical protein
MNATIRSALEKVRHAPSSKPKRRKRISDRAPLAIESLASRALLTTGPGTDYVSIPRSNDRVVVQAIDFEFDPLPVRDRKWAAAHAHFRSPRCFIRPTGYAQGLGQK